MKIFLKILTFYIVLSGLAFGKYGVEFDELSCYRPDIATFTSVFFREKLSDKLRKIKVESPQTSESLNFHYINATSLTDYGNWIFIFAGIGSSSNSIHIRKLTFFLRKSGYQGNILLVPSIFRSEFVKSFSSDGIVGNIPQDAADLNRAIDLVIQSLKRDEGRSFAKIDYLGFSLGALTAAHLSKNLKSHSYRFAPRKVFLVNSPVDLFSSLSRLDEMNSIPVSFSESAQLSRYFVSGQLQNTVQGKVDEVFCDLFKFDRPKIKSFVAGNLVSMVGNVFYQGQRRTSTGYFEEVLGELPPFADREEKRKYCREAKIQAKKLSFQDYVRYAVLPNIAKSNDLTIDQVNEQVSMVALNSTIKKYAPDYYIIHSVDDFLLSSTREFKSYAENFLLENSFVVERGGHLGLLQSPVAVDFIVGKIR